MLERWTSDLQNPGSNPRTKAAFDLLPQYKAKNVKNNVNFDLILLKKAINAKNNFNFQIHD